MKNNINIGDLLIFSNGQFEISAADIYYVLYSGQKDEGKIEVKLVSSGNKYTFSIENMHSKWWRHISCLP